MNGNGIRVLVACWLFPIAFCGCSSESSTAPVKVHTVDLSRYSDQRPPRAMKLLFIHHSCGGEWLAEKGEMKEIIHDTSLLYSHPNGGGLRRMLEKNNYEVHEAAYKSAIGQKTDVCDWNVKFRDQMAAILACDRQDATYRDGSSNNDIVVFKSCFPNNDIVSEGKEPGDPNSPERTTANYKAAYRQLLHYFSAHPSTLFVCITAPPLARNVPSRFKEMVKNAIGAENSVRAIGERARRFNNWLKDDKKGWLAEYRGKNVVVFDYYDILTGEGASNYSLCATDGGKDSHPSAEGNGIATRKFIPFLNRAVQRFREDQTGAHLGKS